jgi:histidinol-phosphate aminotransferase
MQEKRAGFVNQTVSPHILAIRKYVAGKPIAELARDMGISDAIKMASNENPLGPPLLAMKAVEDQLRNAHIYPESSGPELRQALAARFGLTPDHVILGNGSDEIMEMSAHLFIRSGDEAVMGENAFSMYQICVEAFGGKPVRVPMKNYAYDLNAMAKAVSENTRLIFIAIPNSPTGTIVSKKDFELFVRDLPQDRLLLIIDEAYKEYVKDPDCPNGVDFIDAHLPVLVLRTFSKVFGLAGFRVGYGLGEPWLIELLNRVRPPFNVNSLAQWAALAALEDKEHLESTLRVTGEGMLYLTRELQTLGLEIIPSHANFITFCTGEDAAPIYEALLREGVIVRHLRSFGMEKCIRVTIGRDWENRRFIEALRKVMKAV